VSHQPYQQQPGWGTPPQAPQPPRKPNKIAGYGCLGIAAVLIIAGAIGAATNSDSDSDTSSAAKSSAPALTDEQRASINAAAGLPPDPDAATRKAYLDALNAIDPRIAKPGKDDQTVSRGLNQCSSIKSHPDNRDKLIELALDRFTITTRLPDISTPDTGAKVLDAVHKHLCPDF